MITYFSTNNPGGPRVDLTTALLQGLAPDYGLYMMDKADLPRFDKKRLDQMRMMPYWHIAFTVLWPFLDGTMKREQAEELIIKAYGDETIAPRMQKIFDRLWIMWLTPALSYSFKDYAAVFYALMLNFLLHLLKTYRLVFTATSGDTGAAIGAAIKGLARLAGVIFYAVGEISDWQRLQMETLGDNVWAIGVKGDFDLNQELVKRLLVDQELSRDLFGEADMFTSANSISVGRLLPQMVYPFWAVSKIDWANPLMCIPSGNFGDIMGTILARATGLQTGKIICGVNENRTFPRFMETESYTVEGTRRSPSSAMNVAHPSNMARLFAYYGGQLFDERDALTHEVTRKGVVGKQPDLEAMRREIYAVSVGDEQCCGAMKQVWDDHQIILEPHGAVAYQALQESLRGTVGDLPPAVIYETADPGKFPEAVRQAIGIDPTIPEGILKLEHSPVRRITIESEPDIVDGKFKLSQAQLQEVRALLVNLGIGNVFR